MPDLTVSCQLVHPGGTLELENAAGGYELERTHLEESRIAWRRHQVENQWVEGAFTIGAVKLNVEENLAVYVTADTTAVLRTRLTALTDVLEMLAYDMVWTEDGVTNTWRCQVADYTVRTEQALRFAKEALVRAVVPRSPTAVTL